MKTENSLEKLDTYNQRLNSWVSDEKAATELLNVSGMLRFDKTIELIILGRPLNDRGAGNILNTHLFAEKTLGVPVMVENSLKFAKAILANNVAPARIDLARLNREWDEEKEDFGNDPNLFIEKKLASIINVNPRNLKDLRIWKNRKNGCKRTDNTVRQWYTAPVKGYCNQKMQRRRSEKTGRLVPQRFSTRQFSRCC
jgi:hypothetical protein